MKTLGLLGGMSWNSTELYYRLINQGVAQKLGGLHSARLLLYSFDFDDIATLQKSGDWTQAGKLMVDAALQLKAAGADAVVIFTNTMHMFAPEIEAASDLPVLHIGDAVARELATQGITRAGILGTYYTMSMDFYATYYQARHHIQLIAPDEADRQVVNRIIYEELCRGVITEQSCAAYVQVISKLQARGAQAIILGCTEIGLLIKPQHFPSALLLDSTQLHAEYAIAYALNEL